MTEPRVYLLNEQHELPGEKKSGGRQTPFVDVPWRERGLALAGAFRAALRRPVPSVDPMAREHHYLLAAPATDLKVSTTKDREHVVKPKVVEFTGQQASIFTRLPVDLIGHVEAAALIHVSERNRPALEAIFESFTSVGQRVRDAAVLIGDFAPVPLAARLHPALVAELAETERADLVVELQPNLARDDADQVVAAIARFLRQHEPTARWRRVGRDLSGRTWARLEMPPNELAHLVQAFPSIQRVHEPLMFRASGRRRGDVTSTFGESPRPPSGAARVVSRPPLVAVVDRGIPENHPLLAPLIESRVRSQQVESHLGHHGSRVASRVAFPAFDEAPLEPPAGPFARVVDVNAADPWALDEKIDAKAVIPLMTTVATANPDVRVFNLSLGADVSLSTLRESRPDLYDEALRFAADLDLFAHRTDTLLVTSAGNAPFGAVPNTPYPRHQGDLLWHAQPTGAAMNAVVVGATVGERCPADAIAEHHHAPSPFTRVGSGPLRREGCDLAAVGGNARVGDEPSEWLGVPVLDQDGEWSYQAATSYAAPVVARDAAFLMRRLRDLSADHARPFAVTVRACLALTATRLALPTAELERLADLTLGFGYPDLDPWFAPPEAHALFVWQGHLRGPDEHTLLTAPIPAPWLAAAEAPVIRVTWAWDPPVNVTAPALWRCRDVALTLRDNGGAVPARRTLRKRERGATLRSRLYDLSDAARTARGIQTPADGLWTLDIAYKSEADLPDPTLSNLQRVAVAFELVDEAAAASPRTHIERLPIAATMNRLAAPATPVGVGLTVGS